MVPLAPLVMLGLLAALTLGGCLERVTGEFVPLDERYTAGHNEGGQGVPSGQDAGGGQPPAGGGELPYQGFAGDTIKVTGVIESGATGAIQIDVFEPDESQPGGLARQGAIRLPAPGSFELLVPTDRVALQLQAFQDPGADGPSEQDPFAAQNLALAGEDPAPITLVLAVGQRGMASGPSTSPIHTEAAPGAPGGENGGPPAGGSGAPPAPSGFPEGVPTIKLSGNVRATLEGPINIDLSKVDASAPGGRVHVMKQTVSAGAWSIAVPANYGQIEIDAYQDPKNDGPTEGDPIVHYPGNPVAVGAADIAGIDLLVP